MAIQHAIWKVSEKPEPLSTTTLSTERQLEDMIVSAPSILSDQWMLIGRQIDTGFSGRLDLLAIAPDGGLVLIELKRDRTPRDVVAQSIDYASFVENLKAEDISAIYSRFSGGKDLANDFHARFGHTLDDESLNIGHQIIVVASSLDASTERIVKYLSDRDISINVLFFQIFAHGNEQFISRAWLLDPVQAQVATTVSIDSDKEPWNGELYASFGHDQSRSWEEAVQYGFISAGGGSWYSNTLGLVNVGDRIWVKAPSYGFVGVGRVLGKPTPLKSFMIQTSDGEKSAVDVLSKANYLRDHADNPELSEYFVPIKWLNTVSIDKGIKGVGLFGNQNTVCRPLTPKWRKTIDRLKMAFPDYDKIF
jgi:hypothetical protein